MGAVHSTRIPGVHTGVCFSGNMTVFNMPAGYSTVPLFADLPIAQSFVAQSVGEDPLNSDPSEDPSFD